MRYWIYKQGQLLYYVDGEFRSEHETAQYLIDKYGMGIERAYREMSYILPNMQ